MPYDEPREQKFPAYGDVLSGPYWFLSPLLTNEFQDCSRSYLDTTLYSETGRRYTRREKLKIIAEWPAALDWQD